MLRIQLITGETLVFDLRHEAEAKRWRNHLARPGFQSQITAVSIGHRGVQYTVRTPQQLQDVLFSAEAVEPGPRAKGGQRVVCLAGGVSLAMMVHEKERACRIDLAPRSLSSVKPIVTKP